MLSELVYSWLKIYRRIVQKYLPKYFVNSFDPDSPLGDSIGIVLIILFFLIVLSSIIALGS